MRVSVTGGTGFVGSALVRRLLAEKYAVRVLARPSARADSLCASGAEVISGHLGDAASVHRAVASADCLYHIAAMVEGPGDTPEFIEANRGGTENVFRACLEARVPQVVYTSSIAVYGPVAESSIIDESTSYDDSPERRDSYARSKILADQFAVSFALDHALPLVLLRSGIVYGPGKPLPMGLLAFCIGKTSFVFGNARNRFPLNYIENLIDLMLLVAQQPQSGLRQYIVLDDDDLTLAQYHSARAETDGGRAIFIPGGVVQVAAAIAEPLLRLVHFGAGSGFTAHQVGRALQNRHYDSSRVRRDLRWAPRISLRDALKASTHP